MPQYYQLSKPRINLGWSATAHVDCKILVKDLGFDLEHHEKFFEIPCTKLLYQIETGQFTFVADYLKIRNCYNR